MCVPTVGTTTISVQKNLPEVPMKPIDQEFIHNPSIGQFGDCTRAVLASILELPVEDVPHFLQEANGDAVQYWQGIQTFCKKFGYAYMLVNATSGIAFWGTEEPIYHVIAGPSPRGNGLLHDVVGCNGTIVHDPHPSRDGLLGDSTQWQHAYLVRL